VIDAIVPEPEGGAHQNHDEAARLLGEVLKNALEELEGVPGEELRRLRRARFRSLGIYGVRPGAGTSAAPAR
jgi:acetyl-CoA carboxylase carboxyl transferase subunit alpha